ncbi:MAG: hypothetical protein ABI619_10160 [Betaproteobacteria bacterium]
MVSATVSKNRIGSDDETVVVAVKTPLMPKPTTARLPGRLTLRQAVEQLRGEAPKDANATRVLNQLDREMSGVHHFLAVTPRGMERVDPQTTTLDDLAIPREIRTHEGIDHVRLAAFEIQSYAKVGV